ncbi:MAG: ASCH domain-containing protein [Clostridia bacterium]|nr:ASCH domain-containing protein [Clostridia bacterium]
MTYIMQLHKEPFELVKNGYKTVELRLNDEKRRRIVPGDCITFLNRSDSSESLTVRVVALHSFESFESLYQTLPLEKCGYLPDEIATASAHDMDIYYTAEEQERYGAVGIEFELIHA